MQGNECNAIDKKSAGIIQGRKQEERPIEILTDEQTGAPARYPGEYWVAILPGRPQRRNGEKLKPTRIKNRHRGPWRGKRA